MSSRISALPVVVSANVADTDILPIVTGIATNTNVTKRISVTELRLKLGTNPPAGGRTVTSASTYLANNAVFNVKDYGAFGDGVTDDRAAVQLAINAAIAAGGGTILFPNSANKYMLTSLGGTVSLPIPVSGVNFTTASQVQQYHFYLNNVSGIKFVGDGITIKSTITNGGIGFIFNGAQDMEFRGITFESVASFDASGNTLVSGMNMIGFTSTTRDSERILLYNVKALNSFVGFYCFGDAASAFRVRNVTLNNFLAVGGEYGIATHNNGDNITFNSARVVAESARAYFAYGVDNHQGMIYASGTANNLFGQFVIKAYDRDITNIKLKIRTDNNSNGGVYKLYIQSQHHVATQPTPKSARNIDIDFSDLGTSGSGISFEYYQDAAIVATVATTIFDNIRFTGHVTGGVNVSSVQSPRGFFDIEGLVAVSGSIDNVLNNNGFYTERFLNYTPVLSFGGASTGITYTTQLGEFYQKGNFVDVQVEIVLSSKGSSVGAAQLTLPRTPALYNGTQPMIIGVGYANMAAMTGPIVGTITQNARANLMQQGAAAVANLADTNFTNTSRIMVTMRYPI